VSPEQLVRRLLDVLVRIARPAYREQLLPVLRALEERSALTRRLADRSRRRGHRLSAGRFEQQIQDTDQRAAVIPEALLNSDFMDPVTTHGEELSTDRENPGGGKRSSYG